MDVRHLDVPVVSAKDLKKVNLIGKMHTYAVLWVDPYYRQSTGVDEDGGQKPKWNQKLSFPVPEHFFHQPNSHLTVEIYSKGTISKDKFVGAAAIPLSEIAKKTNQEEVLTYPVKKISGKEKGSLRLSIRVGETTKTGSAAAPSASMPAAYALYDSKQSDEAEAAAVPYPHDNKQHDAAAAVPYGYPPPSMGAPPPAPYGYPPQAPYPQGYGGYGGQGYYQPGAPPPQYYAAQPPPIRRPGLGGSGLGMGVGAGLLAGAVGGLIVSDIVDDAFDGGFDGGFDF